MGLPAIKILIHCNCNVLCTALIQSAQTYMICVNTENLLLQCTWWITYVQIGQFCQLYYFDRSNPDSVISCSFIMFIGICQCTVAAVRVAFFHLASDIYFFCLFHYCHVQLTWLAFYFVTWPIRTPQWQLKGYRCLLKAPRDRNWEWHGENFNSCLSCLHAFWRVIAMYSH